MGSSDEIRKRLLDEYYSNVYQPFLFGGGGGGLKSKELPILRGKLKNFG